ncbi:MAG TPA: HAMP domain-containing sensor histidine kinase [Solirubrobacteraceae bacterium]|jgi:signal transduction histidine kinase|nr:HAMP domain-containing sensor histidine kinase [Solirubrobacteraceae bacterium]
MRPRLLRLSLSIRLALVFFSITLLAIAALYVFVAPGLKSRLVGAELSTLRSTARERSGPLAQTVGSAVPQREVRRLVTNTSESTGYRVTLIDVNHVLGTVQLSRQMDSGGADSAAPVVLTTAWRAAQSGQLRSGTLREAGTTVAQAALPVRVGRRVSAVVLYTSSITTILRTVSTVRREILEAGAGSLLLALAAGFLIARAIAQRVRRLEVAAKQMAAGRFPGAIPVDSADELGQLAQAFNDMQSQLRQLDLARKKFIATASHELRTPLFSLSGFVELLEDDELDPETRRRFLEQVRNQVDRLGKLSVDLLDLSRLEAGSLELRPEQVDLGELTRSVSSEFEPTLAQHDARLELRLPAGRNAIQAQADPVRLAQIMRILIDNALTHTPDGTQIVVTAGRANGNVRLAVRDDGEGIDERSLDRIFEPFYTADDAQGSGLGLAIASELASRMSGRLLVDSAPGDTTFTLEIPA